MSDVRITLTKEDAESVYIALNLYELEQKDKGHTAWANELLRIIELVQDARIVARLEAA